MVIRFRILRRVETISKMRKSHSNLEKTISKKTGSRMTKIPIATTRGERIKETSGN